VSRTVEEAPITERVGEHPSLSPRKILAAKPRELGFRFLAGAITSIVAGAVTLAFGARVGGIFLAFPAILAASLTLIEEQEDSAEAREDARGAVVGGCGMAAFAVVAAITFRHVPGGLAIAAAAGAWLAVALGGYLAAWWR
jgi:hypothetical protein